MYEIEALQLASAMNIKNLKDFKDLRGIANPISDMDSVPELEIMNLKL